jgi:ADP-ribose pyrophosphatase
MIKRTALFGINHPIAGKGMSVFWRAAQAVPGRYRAALILENASGFLRIKEDGVYRGEERFAVHPEVCKDLLQHGILQLRLKKKASFGEWLAFLRTKQPTKKIGINMAVAPEVVRIWNSKAKGSSVPFKPSGTFSILERMQIFSSALFGVRLEEVKLPNGVVTSWLTIDAPDAVAIVPVTNDGKIILIEQPRHSAPPGWEIPAGILEKGVAPGEQAALELKEEAGLKAAELLPLPRYYEFVGSCNQATGVFLARGLTEVKREPEEHESIGKARAFSLDEIGELLDRGLIRDAHTMAALMLALRFMEKK